MSSRIVKVMTVFILLLAATALAVIWFGFQNAKSSFPEIEKPSYAEEAIFAGGCFWGIEYTFEQVDGVIEAVSGYTGGHVENPTYEQVSTGTTGHYEAVQVFYDPNKITYRELLDVYWNRINPTDPAGQFPDKGSQYGTAIFYHDEEQRNIAEESKMKLEQSGKYNAPIVTKILPFTIFYPAEDYHQDYYKRAYGETSNVMDN